MSTPNFLIHEMRQAFKTCSQQQRLLRSTRAAISITQYRTASSSSSKPPKPPQRSWPYNGAVVPQQKPQSPSADHKCHDSTDIVPQKKSDKSIDTTRQTPPPPMRVIPKPDLSKGHKLTPRERLHIEVITRQPPRKVEEKKIYRERLQIYHMGAFKERFLAVLKMGSIMSACAVTFVIAPAHLNAGTDIWLVGLIWLGGFVPGILVNYMTKPMISRIFLDLPMKARESSKAAMEYAKNLPRDADIDIRYLKPWALEGSIKGRVSEFEPVQGNMLRPLTFTWKQGCRGITSRFMPTSFYVTKDTAFGEASKNTIPGIWKSVYDQLMKRSEKVVEPKWVK